MEVIQQIRESIQNSLRVIVVDDEQEILNALSRELRSQKFELELYTDPHEVLKSIQEKDFALIISDNMMPSLTGIDLLNEVKKISPDTKRFMLTGKTSTKEALQAFNDGLIHRFITKPWDKKELSVEIQSALKSYVLQQLEKQINKLKTKFIDKRTEEIVALNKNLNNIKTELELQKFQTQEQKFQVPDELKGISVIIIDSNHEVAEGLAHALNLAGISNVQSFSQGSKALEYINKNNVSVIFSEWHLSDQTGIQLLRTIRNKQDLLYQPIFIFIASLTKPENIESAQLLQTDGYLIKPFQIEFLIKMLYRLIVEQKRLSIIPNAKNLYRFKYLIISMSHPRQQVLQYAFSSYKVFNATYFEKPLLALSELANNHYDIVIYDIYNTNFDWLWFRRELQIQGKLKNIALIINAFDEDIELASDKEGKQIEPPKYFFKNPFTSVEFEQTIIDALNEALQKSVK